MSADTKRTDASGVITSTPFSSASAASPAPNLQPQQFRQVLSPDAEAARRRYVDAVWKRNGGIR